MSVRALLIAGLTIAISAMPVAAEEYNNREHLAPERGAKVIRTNAGARNQEGGQHVGNRHGDVVNTGCGKLDIGDVRPDRYRREGERDNVIVITGDVTKVARGCRNNR